MEWLNRKNIEESIILDELKQKLSKFPCKVSISKCLTNNIEITIEAVRDEFVITNINYPIKIYSQVVEDWETFGVYKREKFDRAYFAYKDCHPNVTFVQFAKLHTGEWNPHLVETKLHDDSQEHLCLCKLKRSTKRVTGKVCMEIKLSENDISANIDSIVELLQRI